MNTNQAKDLFSQYEAARDAALAADAKFNSIKTRLREAVNHAVNATPPVIGTVKSIDADNDNLVFVEYRHHSPKTAREVIATYATGHKFTSKQVVAALPTVNKKNIYAGIDYALKKDGSIKRVGKGIFVKKSNGK